MKKLLCVFLPLLFLSSFIYAQSPITIVINNPQSKGLYSDNLSIITTITSTYSMDTVRATVATKSVLLTRNPSDGTFRGTLVLTGLSQGTQTLNIYALDVMGNAQTSSVNFIFDSLPIITVLSPVNNATYQNKLHVKVALSSLGHSYCEGQIIAPTATSPTVNFSFRNSIDTLIDIFGSQTWGSADMRIIATDSLGQGTSKDITVYCDKSSFLTPVYVDTSGKQIIDFKGHRALLYDGTSPSLQILDLTTNSTQTIPIGNMSYASAQLTTSGAVLVLASGPNKTDSIYVWSNNTLTNINKQVGIRLNSTYYVVSGDNFIWHGWPETLEVTNVATLGTALIDDNQVLNTQDDVDSLGNIAYSAAHNIYEYNIATQVKTQITNDASTSFNIYPAASRNEVLYMKKPNAGGTAQLYLFDGVAQHHLGISTSLFGRSYFLRNGYAAFSLYDPNSIPQVWIRRLDTSMKQMSFFSSASSVDRQGNKGSLLFINSNTRYYADSLTAAKAVSGVLGSTFYVNNNFYLSLGNTLFRYKNLTAANVAPVVSSFTPASAGKGVTVKIKGSNFTGATAVSFGGVNATSFNIIGDTTIMAVVDTGATGSVSVTGYLSSGSLAGFTFVSPPTITAFTPASSGTGATVTITGTNLTGATAVNFGGTPAASFTVPSATQIQAMVGSGASGDISVITPGGTATKSGYVFLPTPTINYTTSAPEFVTGQSIVLTASTGAGYTYAWTLNGATISGATGSTYTATQAGAYTVSIKTSSATVTSQPLQVTEVFALPDSAIIIRTTDATCKGSKNGSILISAFVAINFTAEVTGNGIDSIYHFTANATAQNLGAGSYNVCITVDGQNGYKRCFTAVINEPKDLSVYTAVDEPNRTVTLTLDGGDLYNVVLNGSQYTTSQGTLTLGLLQGDNQLSVTTDKLCQGAIVKHISIGNDIILFPNPVDNVLNITLGKSTAKFAIVEVRDLNGNLDYSGKFANQYGNIQVDLSTLNSGIHVLKLELDNSESIFKIIKK